MRFAKDVNVIYLEWKHPPNSTPQHQAFEYNYAVLFVCSRIHQGRDALNMSILFVAGVVMCTELLCTTKWLLIDLMKLFTLKCEKSLFSLMQMNRH